MKKIFPKHFTNIQFSEHILNIIMQNWTAMTNRDLPIIKTKILFIHISYLPPTQTVTQIRSQSLLH